MRQPAFLANITHVSRGVVHHGYTPSTPILGQSTPLQCHFHIHRGHSGPLINNSPNHKENPCFNQIIPPDEDNSVENCNGI